MNTDFTRRRWAITNPQGLVILETLSASPAESWRILLSHAPDGKANTRGMKNAGFRAKIVTVLLPPGGAA